MTKFIKMNGLGNDFVVIDSRKTKFKMTEAKAKMIAYRRFGIGCDQVILLEDSKKADIFMRIYNADGSESGACGNATRCVAALVMGASGKDEAKVETIAGVLEAKFNKNGWITVNMGEPSFDWKKIPLTEDSDVLMLPIKHGPLEFPVAVSMGNPHMVFFVEKIDDIRLRDWGVQLEKHPLFPEKANVSLVEIAKDDYLKIKVWERGVGKTLACGTAACAALVAAVSRDYCEPKAIVELPGGKLEIEWHDDGYVLMTGAVAVNYEGEFDDAELFKK